MIIVFEIQTFLTSMFKPNVPLTHLWFCKKTYIESSIIINYEIFDENNISEERSSNKNSEEVIDHTCDDNRKKLLNK